MNSVIMFALAVDEMGLSSDVVLGAAVFAFIFVISFGWVTKGPDRGPYGRYQKKNQNGQ